MMLRHRYINRETEGHYKGTAAYTPYMLGVESPRGDVRSVWFPADLWLIGVAARQRFSSSESKYIDTKRTSSSDAMLQNLLQERTGVLSSALNLAGVSQKRG